MHINLHYTPMNHYPPHCLHNPPLHTTDKHKAYFLCKWWQDVGMVWRCCGVIPIYFGWFSSVPSLHALVLLFYTYTKSLTKNTQPQFVLLTMQLQVLPFHKHPKFYAEYSVPKCPGSWCLQSHSYTIYSLVSTSAYLVAFGSRLSLS